MYMLLYKQLQLVIFLVFTYARVCIRVIERVARALGALPVLVSQNENSGLVNEQD